MAKIEKQCSDEYKDRLVRVVMSNMVQEKIIHHSLSLKYMCVSLCQRHSRCPQEECHSCACELSPRIFVSLSEQ